MKKELTLPVPVKEAIERLDRKGYETWLVGGVRDLLLGKTPHDWDLTTSATPDQIERAFEGFTLNLAGKRFGTVSVRDRGLWMDITTFRKEGSYADHRHPDSIVFTPYLFEDLKRRDFTVNAIVYHPQKGLRDYFCGERDLKKKWIRAIGDADKRFSEDAIRILRALRFCATLGFEAEEKTKASLHRCKELLLTMAPERILPEFCRMLCGKNIRAVLTEYADVIGVIVPEILPAIGFSQHSPFHCFDVWQHTVHAVSFADPDPDVRLATFFHDLSKPQCLSIDETGRGHFYGHPKKSAVLAREIMQRMKFPTKQIERVLLLITYHDSHPAGRYDVKRLLCDVRPENITALTLVMEADARAHSRWAIARRIQQIHILKNTAQDIVQSGECFDLSTLAVRGEDMIALGFTGTDIGLALQFALEKVMRGEWQNTKDGILPHMEENRAQIVKNH